MNAEVYMRIDFSFEVVPLNGRCHGCVENVPSDLTAASHPILCISFYLQEAESLYKTMVKRFRQNKGVWLSYGTFLLQQGQSDAASALLQRALASLPAKESMLARIDHLVFPSGRNHHRLLRRCRCDCQVCSAGVPLRQSRDGSEHAGQGLDELSQADGPVVHLHRPRDQTRLPEGSQVSNSHPFHAAGSHQPGSLGARL